MVAKRHDSPHISPFRPDAVDCSRIARMLARVEKDVRERLEAESAPIRIAKWVAGGGSRDGRARRAEIALYVHRRRGREGWPEVWLCDHFARVDAEAWAARRARGLWRESIEKTCGSEELPTLPPAPRRATKAGRQRDAMTALATEVSRMASLLDALGRRRA